MAPFVHAKTERLIDAAWKSDAHGILLVGEKGAGAAHVIAAHLEKAKATVLWIHPEKDDVIDEEKGSISVGQIRALNVTLRSIDKKGRIVVIDHAEKMAEPAQNAFLKLLEEPPAHVRFVLITHSDRRLLPTVRSRVQRIDVLPISLQQSEDLITQHGVADPTKRAQLLFIAAGLPAELTRLISDDDYFTQRAGIVRDARTFISASPFERLKVAHSYKDSRERALLLLSDAIKQLKGATVQSGDGVALGRADGLMHAYDVILQNGNVRLQLAAAAVV